MANWKEKGIVPDSDDEDAEDSQTMTSVGRVDNEFHGLREGEKIQHDSQSDNRGDHTRSVYQQTPGVVSHQSNLPTVPNPHLETMSNPPSPSPLSFKVLPTLCELDDPLKPEDSHSESLLHIDDEISKSYVRLSSPLSCLTSSDDRSSILKIPKVSSDGAVGKPNFEGLAPLKRVPECMEGMEDVGTMDDTSAFPSISRRSLRQRNPIQLHPYALEGEKYRRTLMARGMRPLRLAQVQEDARRIAREQASLDPEFEAEDESQTLSIEEELQLSQSPFQDATPDDGSESPPRVTDGIPTPDEGDDDEFPDINDLLNQRNEPLVNPGAKRQRASYSSRDKSQLPLKLTSPRPIQGDRHIKAIVDIFDVPPSPPETSSPLPAFLSTSTARRGKRAMSNLTPSRAASVEHISSEEDRGIRHLPTPVTYAAKHTIDLTAMDPDEEDPFASDTESVALSSSSEQDQSAQVRRVGKKIRGVLPASWLRLDRHTRQTKAPKMTRRESRSLSPIKKLTRRGIAIPKNTTDENSPATNRDKADPYLLSTNSSDSYSDDDLPGFVTGPIVDLSMDSMITQTEIGSVMEDDQIDGMLPSQKRQTKLLPGTTQRKRRPASTSLFQKRPKGWHRQPKITDHLSTPPHRHVKNHKIKNQRIPTNVPNILREPSYTSPAPGDLASLIPNLSILDVINPFSDDREHLPSFIRIAARNARSRKGLGRHSPTRKFIRLSNRGDTLDAQSVLRSWREGTIRPQIEIAGLQSAAHARTAPSETSDIQQSRTPSGPAVDSTDATFRVPEISNMPRKLVISKHKQTQLAFAAAPYSSHIGRGVPPVLSTAHSSSRKRAPTSRGQYSSARPAQLETSVVDYRHRNPGLAFGLTKKALDRLYRKAHKGSAVRGDIQLARFLSDDLAPQTVDPERSFDDNDRKACLSAQKKELRQPARRQKQAPRRIDAGAAVYRQPNEPLILDFLQPSSDTLDKSKSDGKLLGLGSYGTVYTHHFDIFPLQLGVFFHESTFIGSGRLLKALESSSMRASDINRGYTLHQLAGKQLRWGPWDETVSSELGVCFDWIVEQLDLSTPIGVKSDTSVVLDCLTFIVDYVQSFLSFPAQTDRQECVVRFIEVLLGFTERLEDLTSSEEVDNDQYLQLLVDLSAREMVLIFQLLRISKVDFHEMDTTHRLETLEQRSATVTVKLLLSVGLGPIRSLYDDLQYLALREAGIKTDRYAAQAWVIVMHVLQAAHIPRVSFWDVVNSQLMMDHVTKLSDARVFERMWYSMFSLLPLVEFDKTGIIVPGLRLSTSFENWALPQRIAKSIFDLYVSKSRQSPSFNDYCRALFNRCNHLMQAWGWRRHSSIVGTLFDFFATHKLAHLRNEEVYKSPRFLEELDQEPSLTVELEDRCFHILLKIIATSIRQMRLTGDTKGIRNLVTRVLPNHDRQYPKEETVHQRDLASLRNHHDLLCTLFWAAPPDLRPSINLIRELVNPRISHREAYLINLRAWANLTRFVLASTPTPAAYLPLGNWQTNAFAELIAQHQSAEKDVEEQLLQLPLPAKQLISQHTLKQTVQENRKLITMTIIEHLSQLHQLMKGAASDMNALKQLFSASASTDNLALALSHFHRDLWRDIAVVNKALDIIQLYTTQLNILIPVPAGSSQAEQEDDSQEYGSNAFSAVEVSRILYIGELNGKLLGAVREVLRLSLRSAVPVKKSFMRKIVDTWAHIVGTLTMSDVSNGGYAISDFLSHSGEFNGIDMDDNSRSVRNYTGYFLRKLMEFTGGRIDLQASGRDLVSDWLCFLIKPSAMLRDEHILFQFFTDCEPILQYKENIRGHPFISLLRQEDGIGVIEKHRYAMINTIFKKMHNILLDQPNVRRRYEDILYRMMTTMKRDVLAMERGSSDVEEHQRFSRNIVLKITTFFRDVCSIDRFFVTDDSDQLDQDSFAATLRHYALRLHTDRGKSELNHYCFGAFKRAAMENELDETEQQLQKAMGDQQDSWGNLAHHVFTVLTPSFIHAGFVSEPGWLLAEPFLKSAMERLTIIADYDLAGALKAARAIMCAIVNCVWFLTMHFTTPRQAVTDEQFIMLVLVTQFMKSTIEWIPIEELDNDIYEELNDIMAYLELFNHFTLDSREYLASPLKFVVKSLPRLHYPQDRSDNREALIEAYEAFGDDDSWNGAQEQALADLVAPFTQNRQDSVKLMESMRILHARSLMQGDYIFRGLKNLSSSDTLRGWLKENPLAEGPEFSTVVLSDIRNNWSINSTTEEVQIKVGQQMRVAKSMRDSLKDEDSLPEVLLGELEEFARLYWRIASPPEVVITEDRRRARLDDLIF